MSTCTSISRFACARTGAARTACSTASASSSERGDRRINAVLGREHSAGRLAVKHGGVLGQVWRGGSRPARLSRALRGIEVVPLGRGLGREAGALLGVAGLDDVVDAAVVCLVRDGDVILTSDPVDLARLVEASGTDARLFVV